MQEKRIKFSQIKAGDGSIGEKRQIFDREEHQRKQTQHLVCHFGDSHSKTTFVRLELLQQKGMKGADGNFDF